VERVAVFLNPSCPVCWLGAGVSLHSRREGCIPVELTYIARTLRTGGQIAFVDGMGSLHDGDAYNTYPWLVMRTSECRHAPEVTGG